MNIFYIGDHVKDQKFTCRCGEEVVGTIAKLHDQKMTHLGYIERAYCESCEREYEEKFGLECDNAQHENCL